MIAEIVLPDIHRQVAAPIILVAREFDEAALFELADLVGARAQRRLERAGVEIAALPPGGREDRHAGDDQMRVAAAVLGESISATSSLSAFAEAISRSRIA